MKTRLSRGAELALLPVSSNHALAHLPEPSKPGSTVVAVFVAFALALAGCGAPANEDLDHDAAAQARAEGGHGHDQDEHADHDPESTTIPADIAESSGIKVAAAGPGTIRDEHEVQGLLTTIEGRHAHLSARFPGPIKSVSASVGDAVKAGQALAAIESNVSLSTYPVTSPLDGVVLARRAAVGEVAGDAPLFEVADLSKLWVDLHLFGADAQHIAPGHRVRISRLSDGMSAETVLERVLPATATASQSTVARAVIDNADGHWRTGAAVRAWITVAIDEVALVLPLSAVQAMDGSDAVFVRKGDRYESRPVKLGRRDGVSVEVLDGLDAGEFVVVEQSYLIKADIEKSAAGHEH